MAKQNWSIVCKYTWIPRFKYGDNLCNFYLRWAYSIPVHNDSLAIYVTRSINASTQDLATHDGSLL